MRLGRVEKRRVKIINGMEKKYSFFERFCLDRLRALHRSFFDPYFAGDARENRERQATSSQARSKIIDSIFDNVSTFMVSGHTRRTFQDSILKHTGRNVSILLFCAVVKGSWNTYPEYQGSISQNQRGGLEFSAENGYNLGSRLVVT